MAFSKPLALLLLAVLAATAMSAAGQAGCGRKVTVQNLCSHDLPLYHERLANSAPLFSPGYVLRAGTHAEFPVCSWTGRVSTAGAPVAEFHLGGGADGGAWYQISTPQAGNAVKVTVTPHGHPLEGRCPAAGCGRARCFEHSVPGGNCHGVVELKIVFCGP